MYLPRLKVIDTSGSLTKKRLVDIAAEAAKGEYLLVVNEFVRFERFLLDESIKELESSGEKVSLSLDGVFMIAQREYYLCSADEFDFIDNQGSDRFGDEETPKEQSIFTEIRDKSPQLASVIDTLESLHNQIAKTQANLSFFDNPNVNTEFFRLHAPGHFYTPIPSLEEVRSREEQIFGTPPRQIPGIDLNEEGQLQILEKFKQFYNEQPFSSTRTNKLLYYFENGNYGYTDGIVLHCMIRYLQPKRIIEVGCGDSSCNMFDTNELFFNNSIDLTFIDPDEKKVYAKIKSAKHVETTVISKQIQEVSLDTFSALDENDILFIDSSHVSKIDSDVNYLVFEVLPHLKRGVHVHFHDIWYPFEYAKEWIYNGHAWNEAYLVRAFLQYNKDFKIVFFNGYLRYFFEDVFKEYMPLCMKHPGGSLWIRKVTDNRD